MAIEIRQNQEALDRNSDLAELEYKLQVADGLIGIAERSNNLRLLKAENAELMRIWLDGIDGRELSTLDRERFMNLCGAHIWAGATEYGRNVALDQHDLADAEAEVTRNSVSSSPGFKACWEANVYGLRLWGYGDLVDAVSHPEQN